jgi:ubiquinone biosynthesis protein COQ4
MTNSIEAQQDWEQTLLSRTLDMVRAADGDFAVLDGLAKASSDPETIRLMIDRLSHHPQCQQAFERRSSLGTIDLETLKTLPPQTLGRVYADHMLLNYLKPLQAPPAKTDAEFLGNHITETHDLWHVITGSKTDVLGEIQLEAFYVAQLQLSHFWLALLSKNLLKALLYDIGIADRYMEALTTGWLMGKQARPLFGLDWTALWETPLVDLRTAFNISVLAQDPGLRFEGGIAAVDGEPSGEGLDAGVLPEDYLQGSGASIAPIADPQRLG